MNTVIKVESKSVYGQTNIYVVSEHKAAIMLMTGKKTISYSDIDALESLGFTVIEESKTVNF